MSFWCLFPSLLCNVGNNHQNHQSSIITKILWAHFDGLEQERRNSIANALELRLSCTNPSIYSSPLQLIHYSPYITSHYITLVIAKPTGIWNPRTLDPLSMTSCNKSPSTLQCHFRPLCQIHRLSINGAWPGCVTCNMDPQTFCQ